MGSVVRLGCLAIAFVVISSCGGDPVRNRDEKDLPWNPPPIAHASWSADAGSVCVAFSGGGIRSAAFSMGVAQGLNDKGLLRRVNVISATSGGAYTAAWLYNAVRSTEKLSFDTALDPEGLEQRRLVDNAQQFVGKGWGAWTAFWGVVLEPFWGPAKHLSCGVESTSLTPSGASFGYDAAISRLFVHPQALINGLSLSDLMSSDDEESARLPELVIGATIVPDHAVPSCPIDRNELKAGEFSSEGVYAFDDGLLSPIEKEWKTDQVVTASAGAVDIALSDKDIDLCHFPALTRPLLGYAGCATSQPIPKPFYATDGGFTDNLVIRPLMHRQCDTMIVVDGTHDPNLGFDDLVQQNTCQLEKIGLDTNTIAHDILQSTTSVGTCGGNGIDASTVSTDNTFKADAATSSVSLRRSSTYPSKSIAYLKLAIAEKDLAACFPDRTDECELPDSVLKFYRWSNRQYAPGTASKNASSLCSGGKLTETCQFPQQSTKDQSMYPSEFMAYRDLGHWIARERLLPLLVNDIDQ